MRTKELVEQLGVFSRRQLLRGRRWKAMVHVLIHPLGVERDLVRVCNDVLPARPDGESLLLTEDLLVGGLFRSSQMRHGRSRSIDEHVRSLSTGIDRRRGNRTRISSRTEMSAARRRRH